MKCKLCDEKMTVSDSRWVAKDNTQRRKYVCSCGAGGVTNEVWVKDQPPKKRTPKWEHIPMAANLMQSIMNSFVGGKK